jgi:phosphoribosyl-AMP cyclohydrolase
MLTNRVMPEPDFAKRGGLVTAIAQDARTGDVLMVAYMNAEAWRQTLRTGRATYWSTSRNALWVKGETSGHVQQVREIYVDCDADCVLLKVEQTSAACHEGYRSCFFRRVEDGAWRVVAERVAEPDRG